MTAMRLFWSSRSPFARKVMVAAHELGCAEALVLVPTLAMTTREDLGLVAANPLGQLPALVRVDGTTLYDSHVICAWLDAWQGGRLFPPHGEQRVQALRREALGDGAVTVMLAMRAEERRPEAHRQGALLAALRGRLERVLDAVDAEADTLGPLDEIGAIALAAMLAYHDFRMAADWREGRSAAAAWFARVDARPSMAATRFSD